MNAMKVSVGAGERVKVAHFVRTSQDDGVFLYQVDGASFVVVTASEREMGYIRASIECVFADFTTEVLR